VSTVTSGAKDDGCLLNKFVFDEQSIFYKVFWTIKVLSAFTSAYLYGYMAAFRKADSDKSLWSISYVFEIIFAIDMILNFFKDYKTYKNNTH